MKEKLGFVAVEFKSESSESEVFSCQWYNIDALYNRYQKRLSSSSGTLLQRLPSEISQGGSIRVMQESLERSI
jgi:hypothetical protein